jgi:hypothetical protein
MQRYAHFAHFLGVFFAQSEHVFLFAQIRSTGPFEGKMQSGTMYSHVKYIYYAPTWSVFREGKPGSFGHRKTDLDRGQPIGPVLQSNVCVYHHKRLDILIIARRPL